MKIRAWENTLDCIIQKMNTLGDKRKVQSFTKLIIKWQNNNGPVWYDGNGEPLERCRALLTHFGIVGLPNLNQAQTNQANYFEF